MKLPVHFDGNDLEISIAGRCYTLPFGIICVLLLASYGALAWVFSYGPPWASLAALAIIVLPPAALMVGLAYYSSQYYGSWFVGRWYRLPIGFGVAGILITLEVFDARWPSDGEPIPGYFFGGVALMFCVMAGYFGWRKR